MWAIPAMTDEAFDDKAKQTWGRLAEMFQPEPVPEVFRTFAAVPAFLQDFYMNFKKFVWSDGALDSRTKSILGFAISSVARCVPWQTFFANRLRGMGLSEQQLADLVGLSATCAMYNVFFKFRDLSGSDLFSGMGVGLRAHTFANTSWDEKLVELINVCISDFNGCKPCTSGHVDKARQLGYSNEALLEAIQCTATLVAGITFDAAAGNV